MQLGKMHLVKEWFWFLYPTKELAVSISRSAKSLAAYQDAKALSQEFKCNVFDVEPNTCVVLLEVDNGYIKLLDCNGNIGWIYCWDFSGCSELVKE